MITGIVFSSDGEHDRIGPVRTFANTKDFGIAQEQIGLYDDGASHVYININHLERCSDPEEGDAVILINTENQHTEMSVQCHAGGFEKWIITEDSGEVWIDGNHFYMNTEGASFHLYKITK